VLVITDPGVAATGTPQRVADQMAAFGIEARVYDGVRVEPTDVSLEQAIADARGSGPWDAYVAVGGGSAIDTAKAVALLTTNPGELMGTTSTPRSAAGRRRRSRSSPRVASHHDRGTGSGETPSA
jgi:alcohol dehydrogenase class IV